MFIATQELPVVLNEYVNSVIVPKASTKGMLATIGFFIGGQGMAVGVGNMIGQYMPILQSLNIVDKNGKVDLDDLKARAENALKMSGGKLDLFGGIYSFDNADVEALLEIAKRHAVNE